MANPYDQVQLGQQTNQLGAADNSIQYSDMTRFNMISQYQSSNYINENPRSSHNYASSLSNPRFNYGTNGIDTRFYERQRQNQRNTTSAAVAGSAMSWAPMLLPGAFSVPGLSIGAAAGAPLYFINKGIDRTLQRQRAMQQMSSDVEQYRDQLGMPGMTMSQASSIGSNLTRSMFQRGQFFDPQKQQEILRYGLANDMLSGKGRGMVAGDTKTFEKNFKELMDTVAKVSKTMKVTAEGAMSVIKEMQMSGYGTTGQIGASVTSARAYGSMTGLGTQNMLQIGAAGAMAAQGTPYSSAAGAQMYMGGAAMAGHMARGNDPRSMRSVEMAGGVAQAGGVIGQTMMNIMQSGMGARVLASVMTKDGKLDPAALSGLTRGTQSGHDIVSRASQRAHSWGSGGNVMFARNRSEVADQIAQDPILAAQVAGANFNAWRSNRRGTREQQAQAYAQTFVQGGQREQNVFADWMLSDKGFSEMAAQKKVANAMVNEQGGYPGVWKRMGRAVSESSFGSYFTNTGESLLLGTQSVMDAAFGGPTIRSRVKGVAMDAVDMVAGGKYGRFNRGKIGSMESGYKSLLGLNPTNLTSSDLEQYRALSVKQREAAGLLRGTGDTAGWSASSLDGLGEKGLTRFFQTGNTVLGNSTVGEALLNSSNLQDLRIEKGSSVYNRLKGANPLEKSQLMLNIVQAASSSINNRRQAAYGNLNAIESLSKTLNSSDQATMSKFAGTLSNMDKNQLVSKEIALRLVPGSVQYRTLKAVMAEKEAYNTLSTTSGLDTYASGQIGAYDAVRQVNNSKAMIMMGMSPGENRGFVGRYLPSRKKSSLSSLAGVNVKDFSRDPMYALENISERVASGGLDMYDPEKLKKDDKEQYDRIMRDRNSLVKSFGLTGAKWSDQAQDFNLRFGQYAKGSAEQKAAAKFQQAAVGKNEAFYNYLKGQNVTGNALSEVQAYLDPFNTSAGMFSKGGGNMSASVAQTIATSGLMTGVTGAEVQKMAKSGELFQRLYTGSNDISSQSRVKSIKDEIERVNIAKDKGDFYVKKDDGKGKKTYSSREETLEVLFKKLELEQKVANLNETTEGSKGRSMNASVAPPILNYWNSKWSM